MDVKTLQQICRKVTAHERFSLDLEKKLSELSYEFDYTKIIRQRTMLYQTFVLMTIVVRSKAFTLYGLNWV